MAHKLPRDFEDGAQQVRQGIGRRALKPAYIAATWLVRHYPERGQSYNLLNLVVCLSGRDGGPLEAYRLLEAAQKCSDYTPELGGDMVRDQIIGLIRYAKGNANTLNLAAELLQQARRVHAQDPNRLACLQDVEGRLAYAERLYGQAVKMHRRADQSWSELGDRADKTWVYNNLVHWLKAVVAYRGARSVEAMELAERIRDSRPADAPNRYREAFVIRLPLGNTVHDVLTRWR
jgi:hypothetical protein